MLLYLSASVLIQSMVYSSAPSIAERNPERIEKVVSIKSLKKFKRISVNGDWENWESSGRGYKSKVAWKMYIR